MGPGVRVSPDPPMPQSPLRNLATTSWTTALIWQRSLATSRGLPPTAPKVVDSAQEQPLWPQTRATTVGATATKNGCAVMTTGTLITARKLAAHAEENPCSTRSQR